MPVYLTALLTKPQGSPRRGTNREAAVQLVMRTGKMDWVTKPFVIRNMPYTIWTPTPRLAAWRYAFAQAAENWAGKRGRAALKQDSRSGKHKAGDIVLKVQAVAQEVLKQVYKGIEAELPSRTNYDEAAKRYRTYRAYSLHHADQLKEYAGKEITIPAVTVTIT